MELSQAAVETLIFRARRSLATGLEQAQEPQKRLARIRQTVDVGTMVAAVKAALAGSTAVKVAAVVAMSGASAVAGADFAQQHHFRTIPETGVAKIAPAVP